MVGDSSEIGETRPDFTFLREELIFTSIRGVCQGDGWRRNPLIISIVLNSPLAFVVVSTSKDLFIVFLLVPSGGTYLSNLRKKGKERGGFKLSAKSKLYVQDMSEAKLSAPSVCSASPKLIVVALSLSSSNPFLLP